MNGRKNAMQYTIIFCTFKLIFAVTDRLIRLLVTVFVVCIIGIVVGKEFSSDSCHNKRSRSSTSVSNSIPI